MYRCNHLPYSQLQFAAVVCTGLVGADVHTALSKGYWLDIMKAAQEQGEAGNPAVMMIATNLVQSLVNIARQLAGKSWVEYEQAEGYFERSIIGQSLHTHDWNTTYVQ